MNNFASSYLEEHYQKCVVISYKGFCPICLGKGRGQKHSLEPKYSMPEGQTQLIKKTKRDIWEEIFESGVNPAQAVLYGQFIQHKTYDSTRLAYTKLYNFPNHGEVCKISNSAVSDCDARCGLCFRTLGAMNTVTVDKIPGFRFHQSCCTKCPIQGCDEWVPFIPDTILPKQEGEKNINVCKTHSQGMPLTHFVPVLPFKAVPIEGEKDLVGLRIKPPVFKPQAKLSTSVVVELPEGNHGDIRSWFGRPRPVTKLPKKPADKKKFSAFSKTNDYDAPGSPSILPPCLLDLTPKRSGRPSRLSFEPPSNSLGSSQQDNHDKA